MEVITLYSDFERGILVVGLYYTSYYSDSTCIQKYWYTKVLYCFSMSGHLVVCSSTFGLLCRYGFHYMSTGNSLNVHCFKRRILVQTSELGTTVFLIHVECIVHIIAVTDTNSNNSTRSGSCRGCKLLLVLMGLYSSICCKYEPWNLFCFAIFSKCFAGTSSSKQSSCSTRSGSCRG